MSRAHGCVTCPLCGSEYDEHVGLACHAGCPMSRGCRLLKCPHCGYEMPAPTGLTRWLGRWLGRGHESRDVS